MPGFFGNRFVRGGAVDAEFVASASRASGNSGSLGDAPSLVEFEVGVTVAGTTLSVTLEESKDGSTWAAVGAAVNQNGVGTSARAQRTIFKKLWRFVWTVTGANYTFSVSGHTKPT
jgi:hypothetical protein